MSNRGGVATLFEALRDWRRHAVALALFALVLAVAAFFGSREAYYGAALVGFSIWMAWFVLTAIEWIRLADF